MSLTNIAKVTTVQNEIDTAIVNITISHRINLNTFIVNLILKPHRLISAGSVVHYGFLVVLCCGSYNQTDGEMRELFLILNMFVIPPQLIDDIYHNGYDEC